MIFQCITEFAAFPYVVYYYTGTGVMEDPFIDRKPVAGYMTEEEAKAAANDLKVAANHEDALKSTWYSNRYDVRINTANHIGRELYDKWDKKTTRIFSVPKGKYTQFTYPDGTTITLMDEPLFNTTFKSGGSWSMEIMDFGDEEY